MAKRARHRKTSDSSWALLKPATERHRMVSEVLESRALMAGDLFLPPADWSFNAGDVVAAQVYVGRADVRGSYPIGDYTGRELLGEGLGPDDLEAQIRQAVAQQPDRTLESSPDRLMAFVESVRQRFALANYDYSAVDSSDLWSASSMILVNNYSEDSSTINSGTSARMMMDDSNSSPTGLSSHLIRSGSLGDSGSSNLGSSSSAHNTLSSSGPSTLANNTKALPSDATHKAASMDAILTHQVMSLSGSTSHSSSTNGQSGELTASANEANQGTPQNLDTPSSSTDENRSGTPRSLNGMIATTESRASLIDSYFGYRTGTDAGREYAKFSDTGNRFSESEVEALSWEIVRERLANVQDADREIAAAIRSSRTASSMTDLGDWYTNAAANVPAPEGMIVLQSSDNPVSPADSTTERVVQSASANPFGIVQILLRDDETAAPSMSPASAATLAGAKGDAKEEESIPVSLRSVFAGATSALLFFRFSRSKKQREQQEPDSLS